MLSRAGVVAGRIEQGLRELADPNVLEPFRLANKVMAAVGRQRRKDDLEAPKWYPFQLAFLLLNLTSVAEPADADPRLGGLLFFSTGGGKTEAYLGLAAFTMFLRRLRNPASLRGCGVAVIMRYTLRLLTLDQLGRGAARLYGTERVGRWGGRQREGRPGEPGPARGHQRPRKRGGERKKKKRKT